MKPSHLSKANIKPTENGKAAPEATATKIYKEKLKMA